MKVLIKICGFKALCFVKVAPRFLGVKNSEKLHFAKVYGNTFCCTPIPLCHYQSLERIIEKKRKSEGMGRHYAAARN